VDRLLWLTVDDMASAVYFQMDESGSLTLLLLWQ